MSTFTHWEPKPTWVLTVAVASDELWTLPRHDGAKSARFIPDRLEVRWNGHVDYYSPDWVAAQLTGRRRSKDGKVSGYRSMGATWSCDPEQGWNTDIHLRDATEGPGAGGQIPEWIKAFVAANTPKELRA